jgi:hypothetical protein
MALSQVLKSVIGWLRAGYPQGVPQVDYIPLFALLGSHLTDDDVKAIADELASSCDPASAQAIHGARQRAAGSLLRHRFAEDRLVHGEDPHGAMVAGLKLSTSA